MGKFRLSIILLAAGNSNRFHGNKMLAWIDGKPMYLHMVEKILQIPAYQKVLVTQYDEIITYLDSSLSKHACSQINQNTILEHNFESQNIQVVRNEHSDWGISHSIQLGLDYCTQNSGQNKADAYLFAVCDQPWLSLESIRKLINAYVNSEKGIACLSYNGSFGNPVIFDKVYYQELMNLKGDIGGKSILKKHNNDVLLVEINDSKELLDIDTPL